MHRIETSHDGQCAMSLIGDPVVLLQDMHSSAEIDLSQRKSATAVRHQAWLTGWHTVCTAVHLDHSETQKHGYRSDGIAARCGGSCNR